MADAATDRLELAAKLDKELDDFIDSLEKRRYIEGWPEDRWEEEMEKHPFFMKEPPKPGEPLHPFMEGLQELKYSPNENTPTELANAYKTDGNFNFKHKNYRLAIIAYTEGIRTKCDDMELMASLYNNRSASNFFLKNYRSSLRDCELALKIKPEYDKVLVRAANCCYQTKLFDKAINYCDKLLELNQDDRKEISELKTKSIKSFKLQERDERKLKKESLRKDHDEKNLINEIKKRNIKIAEWIDDEIDLLTLTPQVPQLNNSRVSVDEQGMLTWPVIFVYPEYGFMDFIQVFNEEERFIEHLKLMFENTCEWDKENKYKPDNISIYFEHFYNKDEIIAVVSNKTLKDVLQRKGFVVQAGTPSLFLFARHSGAEKVFLRKHKIISYFK